MTRSATSSSAGYACQPACSNSATFSACSPCSTAHAFLWPSEFSFRQHFAFVVRELEAHLWHRQAGRGPLTHGGVQWFGGEFRGCGPLGRIRLRWVYLRLADRAELRVAPCLYALVGDPPPFRQELQQVEQAECAVPGGAVVGVAGAWFVVAQVQDGKQPGGVWWFDGSEGEG